MNDIPNNANEPEPIPLENNHAAHADERREAVRRIVSRQRAEAAAPPSMDVASKAQAVARLQERAHKPVRVHDPVDVERTIGGKLFAAIGAIVVIIGAALFLKLAVDKGWLGGVPPALKCLAVAGFGGLLIAAGEAARRWINNWASSGLSAAGVGALYAAAYAAYGVYSLISPLEAFGLFTLAAAIGFGVAARSNLLFVAIVSIAGGYLSPILFADMQESATIIPINTLLLLLVGLTLSAVKGGRFRVLPSIVWWGTMLYGMAWVFIHHAFAGVAIRELTGPELFVGGVFLALSWAAVHVELAIAARRGLMTEALTPKRQRFNEIRRIASSFSSTAWAVGLGVILIQSWRPDLDWAPAAAGAVATTWMALILAGNMRAFRDAPENDIERLGVSLATQAGACVLLTALLAFAGWALGAAWLALGLSAVAAGAWMRTRGLTIYGIIALTLGSIRVFLLDAALATPGVEVAGLHLTTWTAMAALTGASWIATACLLAWSGAKTESRIGAMTPGVLFLYLSLVHQNVDVQSLCIAYAALSLLIAIPARFARTLALPAFSIAGFIVSSVVWIAAYPPTQWGDSATALLLHPGMWTAFMIAGGALMTLWIFAPTPQSDIERQVRTLTQRIAAIATTALVFLATTLESARIGQTLSDGQLGHRAAMSIWWALFAAGLLIAGWAIRNAWTRWTGLGLLTIALIKTLSYDMQGVPAEWRVASFLAIGLLMLGVAVGYARSAGRTTDPASGGNDESDEKRGNLLRLSRRSHAS